ncbi:kinase-like domain-containing protein [Lactarius psammicola]|nr:kinase-like domain-containing protein [Lactarius psammicola]
MPGSSSRAHGGHIDLESREIGTLFRSEVWWREQYDDIKRCGYQLHPRYHPGWVPSWKGSNKDFFMEDGQPRLLRAAMDATRLHDGKRVMLKKVFPEERPHELQISRMFSSGEVATDPHNHCVPLLDVIELSPRSGSQKLMVFPLLRPFSRPRIQTFGEFAAFFTQICEGIRFLHQRNVAHRDCTANNVKVTAARRPPRYYFIDFGLSRRYPSRDAMDEPLPGGDESAPEHQSVRRLCNPFHTDIYYIGNLVRKEFIEKCNGFEFMENLVAKMTQDDPAVRPPIEDVLEEFSRIRASLGKRKLRSAITSKNAPKVFGIIRQAWQSVRTLRYVVSRRPAIPDSYT